MDLKSTCIVLLGLLCVATFASATPITAADATCSGGAQTINIPEGQAEVSFLLTCPGFTFAPSVAGKTAVFMDTDGNVSDLVVLSNVNGAANFLFLSDVDMGDNNLVAPPANLTLITVNEPTPVVVVATSATGDKLQFTFTSDTNTAGTTLPSETIGIAAIPEPASLTLAGIGGLLIMCGRFLRKRVGR